MIKTTQSEIDNLLFKYGAKTSHVDSLLQSKAEGYYGDSFRDSKKPVYNFDIVSIETGKGFANVFSDIYKKIPKSLLMEIADMYYETRQRIYY